MPGGVLGLRENLKDIGGGERYFKSLFSNHHNTYIQLLCNSLMQRCGINPKQVEDSQASDITQQPLGCVSGCHSWRLTKCLYIITHKGMIRRKC